MIESLKDLFKEINKEGGKLITLYDSIESGLKYLINELKIDCLYFNEDYTPYAKERIENVKSLCENEDVDCKTYHDYCINEPNSILNNSGNVYVTFTPYYEKSIDKYRIFESIYL